MIPVFEPEIGEAEIAAVVAALRRGEISGSFGETIPAFETEFSAYVGCAHGVAVTSGTTALHLAVAALDLPAGSEILVSASTNIATALACYHNGCVAVPVDSEDETWNLDLDLIDSLITPRTRAVIPVHLFGHPVAMDRLMEIATRHNLVVIEDCAESHGASWRGRMTGSFGHMACFSFYANKVITTGEGGMVTTQDAALADTMNMLRNHGASISEEQRHKGPRPYLLPEFNLLGFNYRMTDLQGAVGLVQLGKLDKFINERQRWAEYYREQLADLSWLRMPIFPEGGGHAWQAFVTYVDPKQAPLPRNEIMERLQSKGVSTRPGTHAVHMLGYYRDRFGLKTDDFPGARDCDANTMAIPLHNRMSEEDYQYVVGALHDL